MALQHIGQFSGWAEAFERARKLLGEGKLTAVAVVSQSEFQSSYVATHLEEFGAPEESLGNLEAVCPMLYGEHSFIVLRHGPLEYARPEGLVNGWLLLVIHPD